jgi:regulator of sigma E protease
MLAVIIIISILVLVHELGHFVVARLCGVKVEEFGLGYPPKALKLFTWKKTLFTLNWIPFGGFVRLAGEDEVPESDSETQDNGKAQFYQAKPLAKLAIVLSGALVNFVFAVLLFAAIFSIQGIPQPLDEARIGEIAPGSPASQAGMQPNVTVVGAQDEGGTKVKIENFAQLVEFVEPRGGQEITLTTTGLCSGLSCEEILLEHTMKIRTPEETPAGQGALGVAWGLAYVKYPWYEMPFRSSWYGLKQSMFLSQQILGALESLGKDLVTKGSLPQDISGPVGIVHQAQSTGILNQGIVSVMFFTGLLSVNLAVMNVLPIPPLDGGRALFILIATFLKHRHLKKLEYYANYSGYLVLLALIILVTIRDVLRVIG